MEMSSGFLLDPPDPILPLPLPFPANPPGVKRAPGHALNPILPPALPAAAADKVSDMESCTS